MHFDWDWSSTNVGGWVSSHCLLFHNYYPEI